LQTKTQIHSFLERVPGVGPRRRQEILFHFQTLDSLKRASARELLSVRGMTPALAASLKETLKRLQRVG
jgi:excinuclease ABC subunit C